jgi:GR25 family glycosyltransferase involved in LPS biosynthesis
LPFEFIGAAGELGCGLSNLALYRRLLNSAADEPVTLEDDVIFEARFPEILLTATRLPAPCGSPFRSAAATSV